VAEAVVPPPIAKPDIVVPDAAPLIHLAAAGLLHLLHEVGGVVVVVDMVAHEITRDRTKPGAELLGDWLAEGRLPGSNRPVRVEETETGRLYAAVLEARPDYRLRNGGETAIVEWLAERIAGTDRAVIVLYENGRVPTIVRNQSLDADIDVLTTRAFLDGVERRERAASGNGTSDAGSRYWDRVVAGSPTANPRLQSFSQRRPPR
jgi:hypothetical protein